jgi:hypothetical protein
MSLPRRGKGVRGRNMLLVPLLCVPALLLTGLLVEIQVLSIGAQGPIYKVSQGEVFSLEYVHSMYGVPVLERFRVEKESFTLFHVVSSQAALEYFGIAGSAEPNVQRTLRGFSVPAGSVGSHRLRIGDREISLGTLKGEGSVVIRLTRMSLFRYLVHRIWR